MVEQKSQPYVEKFRPQTLDEIQGNNTDLDEIKQWANGWEDGDPPQLLVGEPGVGKTSTAYALANEMGWTKLEVNASNKRRTEELRVVAEEMRGQPVTGGKQLVILDEVDNISGRANISPLVNQLENPKNPIILMANEERDIPNKVVNACEVRNFSLRIDSRRAKIKQINREEDLGLSAPRIEMLAERRNLRDAIQDLQIFANEDEIPNWEDREYDGDIFEDIDSILSGKQSRSDEQPPQLVAWLTENVIDRYEGVELAMALETLSYADTFNNKAEQGGTNNYRFWRYSSKLAQRVADVRLTEPWGGFQKNSAPSWWSRERLNPEKNSPKARLFRKLTGYESGRPEAFWSYREFNLIVLDLLKRLPEDHKKSMIHYYGLEDDEAELLSGDGEERMAGQATTEENNDDEDEEEEVVESAAESIGW